MTDWNEIKPEAISSAERLLERHFTDSAAVFAAYRLLDYMEDIVFGLACKHLPDGKEFFFDEIRLDYDDYDQSMEIRGINAPPGWEPPTTLRQAYADLGFHVYYNFTDHTECSGFGPRREKAGSKPINQSTGT